MRIGDIAAEAGVSVRSLRYYEEQGLIHADRSPSGQRRYAASVVGRVQLIQQFYAAGLPSRTIGQLLPYVDSGITTPEILEILTAERARIAATLAELERALGRLDAVIEHAGHSADDPASRACSYAHDRVA